MSDEGKCPKGGACKGTGWIKTTMNVPMPGGEKIAVPHYKGCPHCTGASLDDILMSPAKIP